LTKKQKYDTFTQIKKRRKSKMEDLTSLLNANQVASLLGISPATFHRQLRRGEGPPHIKLFEHSHRKWRKEDVENWLHPKLGVENGTG
jgi:predicted DNA-binding transcriptional regulator AlpA